MSSLPLTSFASPETPTAPTTDQGGSCRTRLHVKCQNSQNVLAGLFIKHPLFKVNSKLDINVVYEQTCKDFLSYINMTINRMVSKKMNELTVK